MAQNGWIDTTDDETAEALKTRLDALCLVPISKERGSTLASYNGVASLRQSQTVTTVEYRGLTRAAAEKLVALAKDDTTTVVYYAERKATGASGYLAYGIRSGTLLEVSASRTSEAAGWAARFATTEFGCDAGSGWSTTRPTSATGGTVVSVTSELELHYYSTNTRAEPEVTRTTTTVTEHSLLTAAEADALMVPTANMVTRYAGFTFEDGDSSKAQEKMYLQVGTRSSPEKSYTDEIYGWTVRVTHTEIALRYTIWDGDEAKGYGWVTDDSVV